MRSKPSHNCGVMAVFNHHDAPHVCYNGLRALQHRGFEGAGMAAWRTGTSPHTVRNLGSVEEALKQPIHDMRGSIACGHVRYATTGAKKCLANLQPMTEHTKYGWVAVAHNGNIPCAHIIREMLEQTGASFSSSSDTEVFLALIAHSEAPTVKEAIVDALGQIDGAYCFVIMTEDALYAVRDAQGFHPLVLGTFDGAYIIASETCAFDGIGATCIREIKPGEMLSISNNGLVSTQFTRPNRAQCFFELIYFGRPDSVIFDQAVAAVREECGRILAIEAPPPPGSIVIAVPQSSIDFTYGYVNQSHAPIKHGLVRLLNTRSFLQPDQRSREDAVRKKLTTVKKLIKDQIITVIDDSIVRCTTAQAIVKILREAGAAEVHLRIACPPVMHPCRFGIDMASYDELAAANYSVDEIRQLVNANSLHYLSRNGLDQAIGNASNKIFCQGCLTGNYPERSTIIPLNAVISSPCLAQVPPA